MSQPVYSENYFTYNGITYGIGTKVLFAESVHKKYFFTDKSKNQPHMFFAGSSDGCKRFAWQECQSWKDGEYSNIDIYNPQEDIALIVEPVYAELIPWQKAAIGNIVHKKVNPDVFGGWVLYIVVMAVGLIFNDTLSIWGFATVIFTIWLLYQYRI